MEKEIKRRKAVQQDKFRYWALCLFERKQCRATATDFLRFNFSRKSFNVLDYSNDCFDLSRID